MKIDWNKALAWLILVAAMAALVAPIYAVLVSGWSAVVNALITVVVYGFAALVALVLMQALIWAIQEISDQ